MLKILKIDTSGIELQLSRIASALEGIVESTNPPRIWDTPDDETQVRAFYNDDDSEIIAAQLAKLGKEYKPKKSV